ncbi:hypothetical protein BX600DRAFT_536782 [Xylariales sp. PMI_506]|nr:hypothetical protein BX600DRAFT_536782 [Xylariales sp. PMI_506]
MDAAWADDEEPLLRDLKYDPHYPFKRLIYKPSSRKYSQVEFNPMQWMKRWDRRRTSFIGCSNATNDSTQFGRGFKLLKVMKTTSETRWNYLAQFVQSLCMSAGLHDTVVAMIASFTNLRNLELVGYPLNGGYRATAPKVSLPRLQSLKLRGYFPGALVRNLCSNAKKEHLTHLNLGLLATPTDDAPHMELKDEGSRAPISAEAAGPHQELGAEAAGPALMLADSSGDQSGGEDDDIDDGDREDEEDDFGEEEDDWEEEEEDDWDGQSWPMILQSPIWLPRSLPEQLTKLMHLHLVKPYSGETELSTAHSGYVMISDKCEQVLNQEWVSLLRDVAGTLKELILEHRVRLLQGYIYNNGKSYCYRKQSSHGVLGGNTADRGDRAFCTSVLRFLLEESGSFSQLAELSLRGIQIKGLPTWMNAGAVPGKNRVPDNDKLLSQAFPNSKVRICQGVYPIHAGDSDVYRGGQDTPLEAAQDEGDGLLYDASIYNDYKKKFGPQWRVRSARE